LIERVNISLMRKGVIGRVIWTRAIFFIKKFEKIFLKIFQY